ncbi:MAG TPA: IS982 family transposase [Dokdonella sp.]
MLADLDLLLTTVFVTADDLLPEPAANARRRVSDSEIVTLCVAQAIMGVPSDRRFLRLAARALGDLFPVLPAQSGYFKRRRKLADTIEWLLGVFASKSPGWTDDLLLIDSTPVECARSRETVKRSGHNHLNDALGNAADYGYCASHSRYFWGMRLHAIFAPDGTPRALELASPKIDERDIGLRLLARCNRNGPITLLGDKGYAGHAFATAVHDMNAHIIRPRRKDEPGQGPHLAPIRQRIESIFWTCKDLLTLERHGARTLQGLRERILQRFCCLAACIMLNHQIDRPTRALANYTA